MALFINDRIREQSNVDALSAYQELQPLIHASRYEEASAAFEKLLLDYPEFAPAHNDLGVLSHKRGDIDKALQHFGEATRLDPGNVNFQKNLADFYFVVMGRSDDAINLYLAILNRHPDDIETLINLGNICAALNLPEAETFYGKALEIEPGNAIARQCLLGRQDSTLNGTSSDVPSFEAELGADKEANSEYLISAIVSTCNSERFLRGCLEDLEAQTIADLVEIIVIDSGSQQNEREIVREFQQRYRNIVYIRTEERETVYRAWNRGVKVARGTYLTNANTDDRHARDAFAIMANTLENRPGIALVYADVIITETENETFASHTKTGMYRWHDWDRTILLSTGCFIGPQPMWRRSVHDVYGYFDEAMVTSGDYEFWLRISQSNDFHHIQIPLGLYLNSPQSIEHRNSAAKQRENSSILAMYRDAQAKGIILNTAHGGEKGFVSIVIPLDSATKRIQECFEAVNKHTEHPHEVIFVGKCADSKTDKWLKKLVKTSGNCRRIEHAGLSFADACNRGIAASTGDHILILNCSVIVTEGWLTGMLDCFAAPTAVGIVEPIISSSGGSTSQELTHPDANAVAFRERNRFRRIPVNNQDHCCMLFRREAVQTIGLFDARFATADFAAQDYAVRFALAGFRKLLAGDVFVRHLPAVAAARDPSDSVVAAEAEDRKKFDDKWALAKLEFTVAQKLLAMKVLEKADELNQLGRLNEALDVLLQTGMKHCPHDHNLYLYAAELLIDAQRFQDALLTLEGMPNCATDLRALALTGYCKQGLGEDDAAQTYAYRALALDQSAPLALNLQGVIAYKRGFRTEAAEFFEQAAGADKSYGEPSTNLGVVKWSAGEYEEGLNFLERGFVLSPTAADNISAYHTAITQAHEFARAETAFREAKAVYPHNKKIIYLLIDVLIQQGKHEQSLAEILPAMATFGVNDGLLETALEVRKLIPKKSTDRKTRKSGTVSLCMIVKNEEQHLAQCLASLPPIVDEIIVVDTGSADRTKDIATAFGARVFDFPWAGNFSTARNYSLSKATSQWILVMDADEVISTRDHSAFTKLLENTRPMATAYEFTSRNYTPITNVEQWNPCGERYQREGKGLGWTPSHKVRLFPNYKEIKFHNPVHELVEPSLKKSKIAICKSGIPVHHYGNLDVEKYAQKAEEYYLMGKQKLEELGDDLDAITELAIQAGGLGRYEEAIELWLRIIALNPNLPGAYFNLGYDYLQLGKFEEAIAVSLKARELNPGLREALVNWSIAELCIGDADNAITELESLLRECPEFLPAVNMLAAAYCSYGRKDEGLALFASLKGMDITAFLQDIARKLISAGRHTCANSLLGAVQGHYPLNAELTELARGASQCAARA